MKSLVLSFLLFISCSVYGQSRIALVIGNAAYEHGGALKNPVNDANLMASTLKSMGFTVIKETNANLEHMQKSFRSFVADLDKYDVALFFYAGHGVQVNGENFLIPVDAKMENQVSIEFEAFAVKSVNRYFAANPDKLNIMILDACRNNPYRSWSRGGSDGFTSIGEQAAGTIISFATREGETASDGTGQNGLFTEHLVEQMKIPQNITEVFQNTRVSVLKASNNKQVPQEWNMLTGNFYFTGSASIAGPRISTIPIETTAEVEKTEESLTDLIDYGNTVAELLKKGFSISELTAAGMRKTQFIGTPYQGGIILDIDVTTGKGLIIAEMDQNQGFKMTWQESLDFAESLKWRGYSNWEMPSKKELELMYNNLMKRNIGNFEKTSYWSASESSYSNAWGMSFSSGGKYDFNKTGTKKLRVIREF